MDPRRLIGPGDATNVAYGFAFEAALMVGASIVAFVLGVNAEPAVAPATGR